MFRNPRSRAYCVAFLLFLSAGGLILYKVAHLSYALTAVKPEDGWHVKLSARHEITVSFLGAVGRYGVVPLAVK